MGFMASRTEPSNRLGVRWARVRATAGSCNVTGALIAVARAIPPASIRARSVPNCRISRWFSRNRPRCSAVSMARAVEAPGPRRQSSSVPAMFKYRRSALVPSAAASRRADARSCGRR